MSVHASQIPLLGCSGGDGGCVVLCDVSLLLLVDPECVPHRWMIEAGTTYPPLVADAAAGVRVEMAVEAEWALMEQEVAAALTACSWRVAITDGALSVTSLSDPPHLAAAGRVSLVGVGLAGAMPRFSERGEDRASRWR